MAESRIERVLGTLGGNAGGLLRYLGGMGYLLRESLYNVFELTFRPRSFSRHSRHAVWDQMVRVGVLSIPIVVLVLFFVGMIIAFQMAYVTRTWGMNNLVPAVVGVSMLRELGPLLTAIVLSGFAGASIAAEIGTMAVSEEIMALETSALDPVRFLVMPRLAATTFMTLCLAIIANIIGIVGGFVVCNRLMQMSVHLYYTNTVEYLKMQDLVTGLIKSLAFGCVIALIACFEGLRVRGGAEGVGRATTQSVVYSIVAIITVDLVFSAFFYLVL
jgi:phospholipid/cholesterol/gamma-HCH transport system permease protein